MLGKVVAAVKSATVGWARSIGDAIRWFEEHLYGSSSTYKNEAHLRRVLKEYAHGYFNKARPHQGLGQRIPGADGAGPPHGAMPVG